MKIHITNPEIASIIDGYVSRGVYCSHEEVIGAALRWLTEQEDAAEMQQQKIREAQAFFASGELVTSMATHKNRFDCETLALGTAVGVRLPRYAKCA